MVRVWLVVALLALVFWVYAIVDVLLQHPERYRGVSKPFWVLIVLLFPVIGGVLWFAIGRGPLPQPPIKAPDYDQEFLDQNRGSKVDKELLDEQFETIRRLEAELAALDDELADESKDDESEK